MSKSNLFIPWKYNGNLFTLTDDDREDMQAFVYLIVDKTTEKRYIGKKYLWVKVTKPPLKGAKRKRISWKQSDWQTYKSSCVDLSEKIDETNIDKFEFTILHVCKSKGMASYLEAKEQFDKNVLLDDRYYNGIIQCRINHRHLKG